MKKSIGVGLVIGASVLLTSCISGSSEESTADYPADSIELIIPNAAGGPNDISARIVGTCLSDELGVSVVPKNVEGASQAIGTREVIGAQPDGYTIAVSPHTGLTLTPLLDDVGFGIDDVRPIASVFETAMIFVTSTDSDYETGRQLFAAAESAPGSITVGTPGPTSPKQVVLGALRDAYGVDLKAVPLEGQSGQVSAMLGGNVDVVAVEATNDVREQIDGGEFRPLAAIGADRVNWLPETPTLAELGYPDASLPDNVYLAFGPPDLPDDIVEVLEPAIKDCMASDRVVEPMGDLYVPHPFLGSDDTRAMLEDAAETYRAVVG